MGDGHLILIAGALMAAGLAASLLATRVRVPGLILFLAVGMLVGSDGLGWIDFADYELARDIGVIALILILFEGGLTAGLAEIRPVLGAALSLAVVGTLLTAVITGLAAAWLFDLSTLEGLLLGSILAPTDAAAVFAMLRGSTLRRKLAQTLEGEAGMNDPVAVLLVLGFIDWIEEPGYGLADMLAAFVVELGIGLVVGVALGWLAVRGLRHLRLETGGLYPVASLTVAALAFGAAEAIHGSGFLAVYLAGLALGSAQIPARRTITAFHEGMAWVSQLTVFLALGLLVFPSEFGGVALEGTALALIIALVARPVATAVSTAPFAYDARERLALGWAGLRGAIPVVLATFAVIEDIPRSLEFFDIVFFAVVISTLLQGMSFEPVARWLKVTTSRPALPRPLAETGTIRGLGAEVLEYPVGPEDAIVGARVRDLGLPREALVNVIVRGDRALPPRGSTRLEAGDRLHVLLRQEVARDLPSMLDRWRDGPVAPRPRTRAAPAGHSPIFTVRPWSDEDGDPAHPETVAGKEVVELLRNRHDRPGALVALADGRYAVTGSLLVLGSAMQVQRQARERLRRADDDAERAWWQEVIGAVAA
jgi:cell volume regulation protein A